MINKTTFFIDKDLLDEAVNLLPSIDYKLSLNTPTGDFFYDKWEVKEEFRKTVWNNIIGSLPNDIGEARIIKLEPGKSYLCHADIDDRYHLSLIGDQSFLIDLDNDKMHRLEPDGIWYDMDAGRLHTASNFGSVNRFQLVARKLLLKNKLIDPVKVAVFSTMSPEDSRFAFDQTSSVWLNKANKEGKISEFKFNGKAIEFYIERIELDTFKSTLNPMFQINLL